MSDPAISIFISFSSLEHRDNTNNGQLEKWIGDFKLRIQELSGRAPGEIYFYPDAELNKPIPREIEESLATAEHLICVISDEYLQSVWCAEEYRRFCSRPDEQRKDPLFVVTSFLTWPNEEIEAEVQNGLNKMALRRARHYTEELKVYAETEWAAAVKAAVTTRRSVDLRKRDLSSFDDQLKRFLARPRDYFLTDYAALSAYCLGADRYLDGGWGFSLAEAHASVFPACGLNAVVLRTLTPFVTEIELLHESLLIFDGRPEGQNPFQAVKDRLFAFARLLAAMELGGKAQAGMRLPAEKAFELLAGNEPMSRWTLGTTDSKLNADEYYVALLACLSRVAKIKSDSTQLWLWRQVHDLVTDEDLKLKEKFQAKVIEVLRENDLFSLLSSHSATSAPVKLELAARTSILWLMLSGFSEGQELLSSHMMTALIKKDTALKLFNNLRDGLQRRDPLIITMGTAACACIALLGELGRTPVLQNISDLIYERLFMLADGSAIVSNLNTVAWAAIIIIAVHNAASTAVDSKLLGAFYDRGRALREKRLRTIAELAASDKRLDKNELATQIHGLIENDAAWLLHGVTLPSRNGQPSSAQGKTFVDNLATATFWHPPPGTFKNASGSSTLSGVLHVNRKSKRVELDSEGYRRIFLDPFSSMTGINVRNLSGIQREFGGLDKTLVKMMGETVVQKIYVPSENGYECDGRTFEDRTNEITNALSEDAWNAEDGMYDVLVVSRGEGSEAPRWIHRSAILQDALWPQGQLVISWRFVEMSRLEGASLNPTI